MPTRVRRMQQQKIKNARYATHSNSNGSLSVRRETRKREYPGSQLKRTSGETISGKVFRLRRNYSVLRPCRWSGHLCPLGQPGSAMEQSTARDCPHPWRSTGNYSPHAQLRAPARRQPPLPPMRSLCNCTLHSKRCWTLNFKSRWRQFRMEPTRLKA